MTVYPERAMLYLDTMLSASSHGRTQGKAEGVLRVLETRGFAVPDKVAKRVRACRDIATLDEWLTRAVTLKALRVPRCLAG